MKRLGFYPGEWTYTETYPNGAVNHGTYTSKLGREATPCSILSIRKARSAILKACWSIHGTSLRKVQGLCVWR